MALTARIGVLPSDLAATGRGDAPDWAINKALRWLGVVRAGLSMDRHYPLERYEEHVAATGLVPGARFATWDSEPWEPGRAYAVSVHRRPNR